MTAIDAALPPLRLVIEEKSKEGKTYITAPIEVATKHTEPWAKQWKADSPEYYKVVAFFQQLRKNSLQSAANFAKDLHINAKVIRTALRMFSESTATGCDHLQLRRMARLPDIALEQLGSLFRQSLATLTIPMQELLNIMCLLGKKAGGSRTIAIMASFYRALMKFFCPTIRDWDVSKGKFWDSALAGNSSLRAAVERALKVENGTIRGAFV